MLIIFQGCSKDDFECSPENIEKIIAQTCNEYNKEACVREVIDILSYSCDINKTN